MIRSGDTRLLIDTGLGQLPLRSFHGGALLPELAEAGVQPEDIDVVFITHLHVDHCGSVVTEREGLLHPTFSNAAYRWTSEEAAFWRSEKSAGHA
ncbi:MAG: MBL fold metallo-hydrolase, partial [Chloroflexi bacterium]|nr:MBL fold metallo-hydrolase [Chloroflexota bacterium]